jgi:type IV secretory pathway VirB10-like protein
MIPTLTHSRRLPAAFRGSLRRIRPGLSLFTLLILFPALALAQSPFDTGFTAMQTLFTGTVAKVERADESRFASNLVYSRAPHQPQQAPGQMAPAQYAQAAQRPEDTSLQSPRSTGESQETASGYKRPLEANVDSATGQPYLVYEGSVLDAVLMNRLDGDAAGPVKVLVSNPLYSHDHQHVIIAEGTVVLGEAKKIGAAGLGQQRRMAVVFHRLIMPDGYAPCSATIARPPASNWPTRIASDTPSPRIWCAPASACPR